MNIDNELSCVDLVRAAIKIHELCSIRATKDCKNCIFYGSHGFHFCKVNFPYDWEIEELSDWLKEHESEGIK